MCTDIVKILQKSKNDNDYQFNIDNLILLDYNENKKELKL